MLICLFTFPMIKKTYTVITNVLPSLNQNKDSSSKQNMFKLNLLKMRERHQERLRTNVGKVTIYYSSAK